MLQVWRLNRYDGLTPSCPQQHPPVDIKAGLPGTRQSPAPCSAFRVSQQQTTSGQRCFLCPVPERGHLGETLSQHDQSKPFQGKKLGHVYDLWPVPKTKPDSVPNEGYSQTTSRKVTLGNVAGAGLWQFARRKRPIQQSSEQPQGAPKLLPT